jgi:hypothetical protein
MELGYAAVSKAKKLKCGKQNSGAKLVARKCMII